MRKSPVNLATALILDSAKVLLQYDVIGEIPNERLVIKKRKEKSHFRLRRVNGAWKIIDPNELKLAQFGAIL